MPRPVLRTGPENGGDFHRLPAFGPQRGAPVCIPATRQCRVGFCGLRCALPSCPPFFFTFYFSVAFTTTRSPSRKLWSTVFGSSPRLRTYTTDVQPWALVCGRRLAGGLGRRRLPMFGGQGSVGGRRGLGYRSRLAAPPPAPPPAPPEKFPRSPGESNS
jgi:hypothetical protein